MLQPAAAQHCPSVVPADQDSLSSNRSTTNALLDTAHGHPKNQLENLGTPDTSAPNAQQQVVDDYQSPYRAPNNS